MSKPTAKKVAPASPVLSFLLAQFPLSAEKTNDYIKFVRAHAPIHEEVFNDEDTLTLFHVFNSSPDFSDLTFKFNPLILISDFVPYFEASQVILSAPRAGSTLLFESMSSRVSEFWSIGGESHQIIERLPELRPFSQTPTSNFLGEDSADPLTILKLRAHFVILALHLKKLDLTKCQRFLEKTPRNSLRIPFLEKLFSQPEYLYLYRDPYGSIPSLVEAWSNPRFQSYPEIRWSMVLPEGWEKFQDKSPKQKSFFQWYECNKAIAMNLLKISPARWKLLTYDEVAATHSTLSSSTLSKPDPRKRYSRADLSEFEEKILEIERLVAQLRDTRTKEEF